MLRDEAIKYLNEFILFKKISNITEEEAVECFKLAVEALQQQPSEDEKIIRIKKGTLKARTGRYVIYDVEWLKTHFNTTEAKIYGQPQPKERTEEGTETHACDYISRKAVLESLHRKFADGFDSDRWWNSTVVLYAISETPPVTPQQKTEGARGDIPLQKNVPEMPQPCNDCISREAVLSIIKSICFSEEYAQFRADYGSNGQRDTIIINIKALPSVTPQPKEEPQQKTGHWIEHKHGAIEHIECSECGIWFLKADLPRKSYCPNCGSCNGDMIKNIMRDITKQ